MGSPRRMRLRNPRFREIKAKKPGGDERPGLWGMGRRRPTLPRNHSRSTIGAEELNDRVRDGNGCGLLAGVTAPRQKSEVRNQILSSVLCFGGLFPNRGFFAIPASTDALKKRMVKPHGQLVSVSFMHCCTSTPDLSTSWSTRGLQAGCPAGILILGWASRLDAFSGYPFRTWLPSAAPGGTTGTPEVRPSRSSRTRDRSPQNSCAHGR